MDELKNIWANQDLSSNQVESEKLQKLMNQKSKSLAFWILGISIIEFILANTPLLFMDMESTNEYYRVTGMEQFMNVVNIITYSVSAIFILLFYLNYKKIDINQSVKDLMRSIVNTRKVVKYYIYYNLGGISIVYSIFLVNIFSNKENFINFTQADPNQVDAMYLPSLITMIVVLASVVGLVALFYHFTYGYILRKFMRNYKELTETT